ncbi:DUF4226 domain-containing protein [Mycobacterium sp. LTG2003]
MSNEEGTATDLAAPPAPIGLNPNDNRSRTSTAVAPRLPVSPAGSGPATATPVSTSQPVPANAATTASTTTGPAAAPAASSAVGGVPGAVSPAAADGTPPAAAGPVPAEAKPADPEAAEGEQEPEPAAPGMDPGQALNLATGLATPAITAALGIPASLLASGAGLLAPFATILAAYGQGTPELPSSSGLPPDVLDRLESLDAETAMAGQPAAAYQSQTDGYTRQAQALDRLDKELRAVLADSANNSTKGRDEIERIVAQVRSNLKALGPISNTPVGQMAVLNAISQGLQQAGAVLADTAGKDALNAGKIQSLAGQYVGDLNPHNANGNRQKVQPRDRVDSWLIQALAANGITDPRAVANWLPGLRTMVARESGGNPNAVNRSDSNAAKGTPSQGLMQTIGPTFDAHWREGTERNILNPVSNSAAAIHYMMSRYDVSPDGSDLTHKIQQADARRAPRGY